MKIFNSNTMNDHFTLLCNDLWLIDQKNLVSYDKGIEI